MKKMQPIYPMIMVSLLIGFCFLWTGSGYLTWMYQLLRFYPSSSVDWLTECIGYGFQIIGFILFAIFIKKNITLFKTNKGFILTMGLDFIFIALSSIAQNGVCGLVFGYGMNLFHGLVAGFYLTKLVTVVPQQHRGVTFGFGYGLGSIGSWLLSLIGQGNFLRSHTVLIAYAVLVGLSIVIVLKTKQKDIEETSDSVNVNCTTPFLALAGITILLLSAVKNVGFYFPMADINSGEVSLEFTRVFYAFGLIIAGFINDWNRKYGSICCIAALVFPFIMLTLPQYVNVSAILWIIGYLFFGFFVVYRVVVFTDLAGKSTATLYLACLGLLWGRAGDVIGALLGIVSGNHTITLITISAIGFIVTVFVFFAFYQKLYFPAISAENTINQLQKNFAKDYGLSPREEEVFRLITEGRSNAEIAVDLFISENTVKFHIKNILKKTNCGNRTELLSLYGH